ncbi:MAG: hypothetical protein CMB95_01205 [Flavobacteriaceae bacterium]|nr:hypothetical protein [Flavobacteriaceae bacterium]|tara:strand:+ start:167 stop:424 length:258 start_codon:yes stop_codon:yes gene_type:complete
MKDRTYVFRTHVDTEYGRDIPSSWFYVIATSKEDAQEKALEYIQSVNKLRSQFMYLADKNTFICRAVFERILTFHSPLAINYEPA